jgi:hypothetical protein
MLFAATVGIWLVKSEISPQDVLIPVSSVRLLFGYRALYTNDKIADTCG